MDNLGEFEPNNTFKGDINGEPMQILTANDNKHTFEFNEESLPLFEELLGSQETQEEIVKTIDRTMEEFEPSKTSKSDIIGESIQLLTANENMHTFELNEKELEKNFRSQEIHDLNVVVISVAGAFRKGKSFLLNYFLRYLQSEGKDNWVGEKDEELKGFSWRGGSKRDTTGILLWNKIFICKTQSGEKVGVILMDTQGTFDTKSITKENSTVFALSTMISSIQIFNISQGIKESDLQHLQLFMEYGKLALEMSSEKPFQNLEFLIRDWGNNHEFSYGEDGGEEYLRNILKMNTEQHNELKEVRESIHSYFNRTSCYLMPHPGLIVRKENFNGNFNVLEADFQSHLKSFIISILSPENLILKKINGQNVTVKQLVEYFKTYLKLFNGQEFPEPKSILRATAEANNVSALNSAIDVYNNTMRKFFGEDPFMQPNTFEINHHKCTEMAIEQFNKIPKMGGTDFSEQYYQTLLKKIEEIFEKYSVKNKLLYDQDQEKKVIDKKLEEESKNTEKIKQQLYKWEEEGKQTIMLQKFEEKYDKALKENYQKRLKINELTSKDLKEKIENIDEIIRLQYDILKNETNDKIFECLKQIKKDWHQAREEKVMSDTVNIAITFYNNEMNLFFCRNHNFVNYSSFKFNNAKWKKRAKEYFQNQTIFSNSEKRETYEKKLSDEIEHIYKITSEDMKDLKPVIDQMSLKQVMEFHENGTPKKSEGIISTIIDMIPTCTTS